MVAGQMHIWVPTARHAQSPARQSAPCTAGQGHFNGFQPQTSVAVDHLAPCDDLKVVTLWRIGPDINHGGNGDAFCVQICSCSVPVVIIGEDRHILGCGHRPSVGIAAHRSGQHNSGPIIVLKGDGALGRSGAEQAAFGIDPPEHLPWFAGRGLWQVVRDTLQSAKYTVIKSAQNCGACHDADIGKAGQLRHGLRGPI